MIFNMLITNNFASFYDEDKEVHIFIDSFDNQRFEMRIGDLEHSKPLGSVIAFTDDELNIKLLALYIKY
ncbi:hypothetical protein ACLKMI_09020 [Pseudoalteromonas sp. KJ71-7]|uniref:hypothetical protein n=1 Tax=Pseudoalteromonas sp. KJ71-7 TaxID=3391824 RepID=UPI0039B06C84